MTPSFNAAYFPSNNPSAPALGNAQSFYVDLDTDSDEDDTHMVDAPAPMTDAEIATYVVTYIKNAVGL